MIIGFIPAPPIRFLIIFSLCGIHLVGQGLELDSAIGAILGLGSGLQFGGRIPRRG